MATVGKLRVKRSWTLDERKIDPGDSREDAGKSVRGNKERARMFGLGKKSGSRWDWTFGSSSIQGV